MTRLAVCIDWPYTNIPWINYSTLWASDVRREPDVFLLRAVSPEPSISTNMMIAKALEMGADEILGLSADQGVPKDILARFRSYNKDVVGALTATRQDGHHWLTFNFDEHGNGIQTDPTEPLQKIDMVGGCALYKADVFRKVPPPWFKSVERPDGCGLLATSDFYFFRKLKEYGIEVYIDSTVESPHAHDVLLTARTLGKNARFLEIHDV